MAKVTEKEIVKETVKEEVKEEKAFDRKAYDLERVEYEAFYDGDKYKDPIEVGYNGTDYRIKRGVKVMIPRAVKEIIQNSERQKVIAGQFIMRKENERGNVIASI